MKKPNITKCEWVFDGDKEVFTMDNDDAICLLEDYISKYENQQRANGKAISAVPEMIDALMAVMEHNEIPCQENYENMIKASKQALKKAGVQL